MVAEAVEDLDRLDGLDPSIDEHRKAADSLKVMQEAKQVEARNKKRAPIRKGPSMADMQNQINQLQLAQAMQGVVRYPDSFAYNAGNNPFCGCGAGCCNI